MPRCLVLCVHPNPSTGFPCSDTQGVRFGDHPMKRDLGWRWCGKQSFFRSSCGNKQHLEHEKRRLKRTEVLKPLAEGLTLMQLTKQDRLCRFLRICWETAAFYSFSRHLKTLTVQSWTKQKTIAAPFVMLQEPCQPSDFHDIHTVAVGELPTICR